MKRGLVLGAALAIGAVTILASPQLATASPAAPTTAGSTLSGSAASVKTGSEAGTVTPAAVLHAAMPQATCRAKKAGVLYVTDHDLCGSSTWYARDYVGKSVVGSVTGRYTVTAVTAKTGSRKVVVVVGLDKIKTRGNLTHGRLSVTLPCTGKACSKVVTVSKYLTTWQKRPYAKFTFLAPAAVTTKAATAKFRLGFRVSTSSGVSDSFSVAVASYRCGPSSEMSNGYGCTFIG
jgi:hypothetical protein